jgi:hypothetical protein
MASSTAQRGRLEMEQRTPLCWDWEAHWVMDLVRGEISWRDVVEWLYQSREDLSPRVRRFVEDMHRRRRDPTSDQMSRLVYLAAGTQVQGTFKWFTEHGAPDSPPDNDIEEASDAVIDEGAWNLPDCPASCGTTTRMLPCLARSCEAMARMRSRVACGPSRKRSTSKMTNIPSRVRPMSTPTVQSGSVMVFVTSEAAKSQRRTRLCTSGGTSMIRNQCRLNIPPSRGAGRC